MTELKLALVGNLEKELRLQRKEVAAGIFDATAEVANFGKKLFRRQIRAAGLGRKVEKAWRHNVYPRKGTGTLEPAAVIFSNAPKIVRAFDEGAAVRPKGKSYLVIPTEFAPRSREKNRRGRAIGIEEFQQAYGEESLTIVEKPGSGRSVLYVLAKAGFKRSRSKSGGSFKIREGSRAKSEQLLMYVLVKQVRLSKRLNVKPVERLLAQRYPDLITKKIRQRLGQ